MPKPNDLIWLQEKIYRQESIKAETQKISIALKPLSELWTTHQGIRLTNNWRKSANHNRSLAAGSWTNYP